MLESYWVVDSIASRLRVTVSPRIISRNLDVVGNIKTPQLHLNLDLSPKQGYEYVSILWIFLLSKIQIQIERVRSIFNPANFQSSYNISTRTRFYLKTEYDFPNRVFIYDLII